MAEHTLGQQLDDFIERLSDTITDLMDFPSNTTSREPTSVDTDVAEEEHEQGPGLMGMIGEGIEDCGGVALLPNGTVKHINIVTDHEYEDKWVLLFFYAADFSAVCPTELQALNAVTAHLLTLDCQVIAISTDSVSVHRQWARTFEDPLQFPLISDRSHALCEMFSVLDIEKGVANRASIIIDPDRVIQYYSILPLSIGRSIKDLVRTMTALHRVYTSNGQCMTCADWEAGDSVIPLDTEDMTEI